MAVNIIYVLISLIFLFLIYLIIKSLIKGLDKKIILKNNIRQY